MLIDFDGFDWYEDSVMPVSYNDYYSFSTLHADTRYTVGNCVQGLTRKNLKRELFDTTVVFGCAVRINTITSNMEIFSFGFANFTEQFRVTITTAGLVRIARSTTQIAIGTIPLASNAWYYLEFKFNVHNTTAAMVSRVNGVEDINATGLNLRNSTTLSFETISFTSTATRYDDYYILDTTGTINNDFLGERICRISTPSTDSQKQWTRSVDDGVLSNASAINVSSLAGPYISSNTEGHKDIYTHDDLADIGTAVNGVKNIVFGGKTAGSARVLRAGVKFGAEVEQTSDLILPVGTASIATLIQTKDGTNAITKTDLDAMTTSLELA